MIANPPKWMYRNFNNKRRLRKNFAKDAKNITKQISAVFADILLASPSCLSDLSRHSPEFYRRTKEEALAKAGGLCGKPSDSEDYLDNRR